MNALGMIETRGLIACVEAADAAVKAADVRIVGYEKVGTGLVTVLFRGEVAACKAACNSAANSPSMTTWSRAAPRRPNSAAAASASQQCERRDGASVIVHRSTLICHCSLNNEK